MLLDNIIRYKTKVNKIIQKFISTILKHSLYSSSKNKFNLKNLTPTLTKILSKLVNNKKIKTV